MCLPTERWSNCKGKNTDSPVSWGEWKSTCISKPLDPSSRVCIFHLQRAKGSEKSTLLSVGQKGQNQHVCTSNHSRNCFTLLQTARNPDGHVYGLGWRGKKEVKKKSSQDNVLRGSNSTEAFVYLLLDCAVVHFFPHWCGMTYQTLCWKIKFTNSISKYKQIPKTYSHQWKFWLSAEKFSMSFFG